MAIRILSLQRKSAWALDYKKLPHRRRTFLPECRHCRSKPHRADRGPGLLVDRNPVFDSTRIIETLEHLSPEPGLYPADAAQQQRALELENFFDEELGPYDRQLIFYLVLPYPHS